MRCEHCHGSGHQILFGQFYRSDDGSWNTSFRAPCLECGGTGIIHCCDGLKEQPEPEKD